MKKKSLIIFFIVMCIFILPVICGKNSVVFAAGVVAAKRQAAQRQAAYIQMQQEVANQKAYQQVYQQQMAQQRAVIQQRAYQEQVSQLAYQRKLAAQQKTLQEQILIRNQIQNQQKRALGQGNSVNMKLESPALQTESVLVSKRRSYGPDGISDSTFLVEQAPDQVVDIYDIWEELTQTSRVWLEMMDRLPKEATVKKYIDFFKQQNVVVRKLPTYYVDLIDQMSRQNPEMLDRPFEDVFRLLTIMEYDFDNGMDPDALARQVLGSSLYEQNKQRLGR